MLLRIQKYDVNIKYVPGSDVKLADALSRVNPCNTGPIRGLDLSVHEVYMHLNASPTRIVEIRMEISKGSTLHALCEIISLGWPENRVHCPAHLMPFWNFRYWKVNALSCQRTRRSTRTIIMHTKVQKMQASCKDSCLLVWYQPWHRLNGQIACAMPGTPIRQHERNTDSIRRAKTCLAHSSYRSIPLEWHGISANCRLLQQVSDHTNTDKHQL